MARMRSRDRMKDDPVGDYNETKSGLDEAIMSYQSGETVTPGQIDVSAFPMAVRRQEDIKTRGSVAAKDRSAMGDRPTGEVARLTGGASEVDALVGLPPNQTDPAAEDVRTAGVKGIATAPDSYFGTMSITERMKPAATSGTTPVLKRGKFNSDAVRALQIGLQDIATYAKDSSFDPGAADSDFGKNTENAVKAFQKKMGLAVTGVADQDTLDRIRMVRAGMQDDDPIERFAVGVIRSEDQQSPMGEYAAFSDADIVAMDMDTRRSMIEQGRISPKRMGDAFERTNQATLDAIGRPAPAADRPTVGPSVTSTSRLMQQLLALPQDERRQLVAAISEDTGQ